MFHKVVKVKIQVLEFSKWKFKIKYFWLVEALAWSIEMMKKIILESLDDSIVIRFRFDRYSIPARSIEKSIWSIESHKTGFSADFSEDYSKRLKMFQALWMVLWNILTIHTCLLMKYNPMGINKGLCSLETNSIKYSKLERNTRNPMVIFQNCYL